MGFATLFALLTVIASVVVFAVGVTTLHRANKASGGSAAVALPRIPAGRLSTILSWLFVGVVALIAPRVFCSAGVNLSSGQAPSLIWGTVLIAIGAISLLLPLVRSNPPATLVASAIVMIGIGLAILPVIAPTMCSAPSGTSRSTATSTGTKQQVSAALDVYYQDIEAVFDRVVGSNRVQAQNRSARAMEELVAAPSVLSALGILVFLCFLAVVTVLGFNRSAFARGGQGWYQIAPLTIVGLGLVTPLTGVVVLNLIGSIDPRMASQAWYAGLILGLVATLWLIVSPTELRTPDGNRNRK